MDAISMVSPPNHPLLHVTDREDVFSFAYVLAIIGSAGYNFGKDYLDRDSEDLYVKHRTSPDFIPTYKRLGIQTKCTFYYKANDQGVIPFKLKRKNYDDLRTTSEPHVLVVVTVPDEMQGCTEFGADHLVLRYRAYWVSLRNCPSLKNDEQSYVTVQVPISQEFTVDSLHRLMAMIAQGEKP